MIPLTSTFLATFLLLSPVVLAFPNSIYVIRDAETPSLRRPGLTPVGLNRAEQCLPNVRLPLLLTPLALTKLLGISSGL